VIITTVWLSVEEVGDRVSIHKDTEVNEEDTEEMQSVPTFWEAAVGFKMVQQYPNYFKIDGASEQ
jgi:hypothetical protein